MVIFVGGACSRQDQQQRAEMKVLVDIAVRHKLPLPPDDAQLVLAHTESWSDGDVGIYSPAFLLEIKSDGTAAILRGCKHEDVSVPDESSWRRFPAEGVEPAPGGYAVEFDRLSTFVCAVQVAARGDTATAINLWKRFAPSDHCVMSDGDTISPKNEKSSVLLARCIFDDLRQNILKRPEDWEDLQGRLHALLDEFPELKTPARLALLADLQATVKAEPATPDSTEDLLLQWSRAPSSLRHLGLYHEYEEAAADVPARAIVMKGFEAIPDLIRLVDDCRITVHEDTLGTGRRPAHIRRVGELAEQLLRELTGDAANAGVENKSAAWREWWESAQTASPEEFFTAAIFRRDGDTIDGINESPARIVAERYPHRLIQLCDQLLESGSDQHSFDLSEVIAASRLPKQTRVELLVRFANVGSLDDRRCVLQDLAKVDSAEAARLLMPLLERLPQDSSEPYWTCPEAAFVHAVMQIDDDAIWREWHRLARRATVGLRMEMLNPLDYAYIGEKNRSRRLAILAAFLNDDSERRMSADPDKFEGPCAAFTFPQIEVRNYVAMQIASILEIPARPRERWTAARWADFRNTVQLRLAEEDLPEIGD
jgi:hypothetical protein